jgi:hypothetical protein
MKRENDMTFQLTLHNSRSSRWLSACFTVLMSLTVAPPASAQSQPTPQYSAKVLPSITTPDTVQTRIGTLKFFDGLPDAETVRKVYDNLDFGRGVEAFMAGMPAASIYGMCQGTIARRSRRFDRSNISRSLTNMQIVL